MSHFWTFRKFKKVLFFQLMGIYSTLILFPSDQELKVALVVVNMPLGGMVDKFMALSNIGQYGICVVSAIVMDG